MVFLLSTSGRINIGSGCKPFCRASPGENLYGRPPNKKAQGDHTESGKDRLISERLLPRKSCGISINHLCLDTTSTPSAEDCLAEKSSFCTFWWKLVFCVIHPKSEQKKLFPRASPKFSSFPIGTNGGRSGEKFAVVVLVLHGRTCLRHGKLLNHDARWKRSFNRSNGGKQEADSPVCPHDQIRPQWKPC